MRKVLKVLLAVVVVLVGIHLIPQKNSPAKNTVMITNRAGTSGGTGIILNSTKNGSLVLTNDHICNLIKDQGGILRTPHGNYNIVAYKESQLSDLCEVIVQDNLHEKNKLAKKAPKLYDPATVSGHPALMPNVLSTGHVSGREVIQVMTGIRPCTKDEESSELALICAFLGGIPVVRNYESQLVTATIMPGSSGSGVYNKSNELIGVVFAGSGQLGYAWTVPYEQLINFLYSEGPSLKFSLVNQEQSIFGSSGGEGKRSVEVNWSEIRRKCNTATDKNVIDACNLLERDVLFYGN